jgi:hypothetical protein
MQKIKDYFSLCSISPILLFKVHQLHYSHLITALLKNKTKGML